MKQPMLWIHGWGMSSDVWQHSLVMQPHMQGLEQGLEQELEQELEQGLEQGLEHHDKFFSGYEHHYVSFADCNGVEDFRYAIVREFHKNAGAWIVVGWSMGGMLALELMFDEENRKRHHINMETIVIIGSTLRFVSEDRHLGWPLRVLEKMKSKLSIKPQETLNDFKKLMFGANGSENYKEEFTPSGLMAGLEYLIETDLREPWQKYQAAKAAKAKGTHSTFPQLFWIHGNRDLICPIHAAPDLSFKHKVIIEDTGHVPFITEPIRFYEFLRGFLHVREYKQRTAIVE